MSNANNPLLKPFTHFDEAVPFYPLLTKQSRLPNKISPPLRTTKRHLTLKIQSWPWRPSLNLRTV
jgi:hypothetical protein